jgi:gluconolactonase
VPAHVTPDGWRQLAEGAGFVEGPVWDGEAIAFVSVNRGLVYRAELDGSGSTVIAETGAGPNGATLDASGRIWLVQNGARVMESRSDREAAPGIQIIDRAGTVHTELARDELHAPNDCAFGPDGRLWFTDPYGRLMDDPAGDPGRTGAHGRVWAYTPGGGDLELIAENLPHPNGLCFSADGARLLVSDTRSTTIVALEVDGSGPRPAREVAKLPAGRPDGMAFDSAGRLWIAATDAEALAVLDPDGSWELVPLGGSFPTNVCFAGDELGTIVVTAARGGRVLAAPATVPGLPLHSGG